MRRIEMWIVVGLMSVLLVGCATGTRFNVRIDALASTPGAGSVTPTAASASASSASPAGPDDARSAASSAIADAPNRHVAYVLLPADESVDPRGLEYQAYARTLDEALSAQGFERVTDAGAAELAILFDYGVGEKETSTVTYPRSAFAGAAYNGFYGRGRRGRGRNHRGAGYRGRGFRGGFFPGSIYGPAGLASARTYTTYNRFLVVEARRLDSKAGGASISPDDLSSNPRNGTPVWSTRIESRGSSDDLRRVFPILLGAGSEHFATDSGERIETLIREDDPRVARLRPSSVSPQDSANKSKSSTNPSWVPSN